MNIGAFFVRNHKWQHFLCMKKISNFVNGRELGVNKALEGSTYPGQKLVSS
jgi:hypothetical protein